MNTKLAGIAAGCMLAMMAIAPMGLAHNSSSDKPTGVYYGGAGPWVELRADDIDGGELGPINPGFLFAAGNALCDMEILSDGDDSTTEDNFLDEPSVDDGGNGASDGGLDEGTFDDGGQGAVCHTPDTHYVTQDYNTQQCAYSDATATDANSADVWISTSCDYKSSVISEDDPTPIDIPLNLVGCVLNSVITVNPVEVVGCATTALGEILGIDSDEFIECFVGDFTPATCPPGSGGFACGQDGSSDDGNSGFGSAGVPYPDATVECPDAAGTDGIEGTADDEPYGVAAVFVWDAVIVDNDSVGSDETGVYVATTGTVA